jgi:hypothetical protein
MSDGEGNDRKSGYRLEYAATGRAKCKGPFVEGTRVVTRRLRLATHFRTQALLRYVNVVSVTSESY